MPSTPRSYPQADYLRLYEELYAAWMRAEQALHAAEHAAGGPAAAGSDAARQAEQLRRAADEALAMLSEFVRSHPI